MRGIEGEAMIDSTGSKYGVRDHYNGSVVHHEGSGPVEEREKGWLDRFGGGGYPRSRRLEYREHRKFGAFVGEMLGILVWWAERAVSGQLRSGQGASGYGVVAREALRAPLVGSFPVS